MGTPIKDNGFAIEYFHEIYPSVAIANVTLHVM